MKTAEKILDENCGINYFETPNIVHATLNDVLTAMEVYAKEYAKTEVSKAWKEGYASGVSEYCTILTHNK